VGVGLTLGAGFEQPYHPHLSLYCIAMADFEGRLSSGWLTQVEQQNNDHGACSMETPRAHRDRAEECLAMAQHISDSNAAELLRAAAARHIVQATELEKQTIGSPPTDALKYKSPP
jgi:hypothetical protein